MTKKSINRRERDHVMVITFHKLYEKCLSIAKTRRESYELAERVHKSRFGKRHYKNYMSFANSRKHYMQEIKPHS